ncbi:reverse transcriptase domain-containing protein [Tanacetum coccineum]
MEDQPLPADASPTALSAGYIADFNSEEDEEDPADHPADGGDNDDNESSNDDDDDDDDTLHYVRSLSVMNFLGMKLHIHFVSYDLQEMMTTVNQGMSVEEIERVVSQRVANVIEAIATKTNIARKAHTTWPINKKAYAGSLPLWNQCKFYHNGPCTIKCENYKKVGHITQNCKTLAARNQQTRTCYECGSLRCYKSECPIVKFQNHVDMIHGRVMTSKPKTMQDAIEFTTELMNKKISTLAKCQAKNKTPKNSQNQQYANRGKICRAYTLGHKEKKHYGGSKPLCSKCNYHHDGPCAPKCHKCNRVGHLAHDCRSSTDANTTNNQRGTGASQKATCYECGN